MDNALRDAIQATAGHPGPIGVFDSGYGGLTILREIRRALPDADYIYLGDNARAPYGTRSFDSVYHFTLQAVEYLFAQGCQLVILACNTASAKALRTIQQRDLPSIDPQRRVLGVIRPTAESIGAITRNGHVGLFGTPGTVASGSYDMELAKLHPHIHLTSHACPMWVPLVENREADGDGADYFIRSDIEALFSADPDIDTVILGCTHYPLLLDKIRKYIPEGTHIFNQGATVARSLLDYLRRHPDMDRRITRNSRTEYLTTGQPGEFSSLATLFIGNDVDSRMIIL